MTLVMRCEDEERLVSYLYDDGSDTERAAVEASGAVRGLRHRAG